MSNSNKQTDVGLILQLQDLIAYEFTAWGYLAHVKVNDIKQMQHSQLVSA